MHLRYSTDFAFFIGVCVADLGLMQCKYVVLFTARPVYALVILVYHSFVDRCRFPVAYTTTVCVVYL